MKNRSKTVFIAFVVLWLVAILAIYLQGSNFQVLNPKGTIAESQRDLIVFTSLMSLIVVIPVFVMTFFIAWKYRASNTKAHYRPDWDHNRLVETVWWGIPLVLIAILSVITWRTTHELDPFKSLQSDAKPLTVQVVALQWKWLFIYPEQKIASINFVQFPEDRPVNFEVTSSGPMNSFWVPQLGGQIYAMSGMSTKIHLMATEPGDYRGSSANISGAGFAGMKFTARASSQTEFDKWAEFVKQSPRQLDEAEYTELLKPTHDEPVTVYGQASDGLYNKIMMKSMGPQSPIHEVDDAHIY